MKSLQLLLLLIAVSACSEAVSPPPPPPPPPPFTARVTYCAGAEPVWVAFQDGDEAWTRALPSTSNSNIVFQRTFASDRAAIATAFDAGFGITAVQVLYGTPDELELVGRTYPAFCLPFQKILLTSVAGLDANQFAYVAGGYVTEVPVLINESFALEGMPPGPRDIVAARVTFTASSSILNRLILRRGVDLPSGATLPVLDFNSAEAFAPAIGNVTLNGIGDRATVSTRLITSNFDGLLSTPFGQPVGTVGPYAALPEDRLQPGDLEQLAAQTQGVAPSSRLSTSVYFRTPIDRTLEFGPEIIPPGFTTVAELPTLRLLARFVPQDAYDRAVVISYQQDVVDFNGAHTGIQISVSMTAAYAQLIGAWDLTIPELTGVTGFQPAWALIPGFDVRWSAVRLGGTLPLGFTAVPRDGDVQRIATRDDVVTP
jgi:hypothetical protein